MNLQQISIPQGASPQQIDEYIASINRLAQAIEKQNELKTQNVSIAEKEPTPPCSTPTINQKVSFIVERKISRVNGCFGGMLGRLKKSKKQKEKLKKEFNKLKFDYEKSYEEIRVEIKEWFAKVSNDVKECQRESREKYTLSKPKHEILSDFIIAWNKYAKNSRWMTGIAKISDKRRKLFYNLCNTETEYQKLRKVFAKCVASDFLLRDRPSQYTFVVSLDWFLKEANYIKILEGKYDNKKQKPINNGSGAIYTPKN